MSGVSATRAAGQARRATSPAEVAGLGQSLPMGGGQVLQIAESSVGPGCRELRLEGELDLWSVERLQAVLQRVAREEDAVVVGLESCQFVDSTGIALFLQVRRQLEAEGGQLVLYGCSEQVLRIFTVAGLTDAGLVFDTRAEALAELTAVD